MNLPQLDFPRFFETLAKELEHPPEGFAFCAAGFGVDEPTLEAMATRAGLRFAAVATHLQRAATWRNRSEATILAIARGEPEGGNTLQEFTTASSAVLAKVLLRWMADPEHEFSRNAPPTHGNLLRLLANNPPKPLVLSLEGVSRFAAAWATARASSDPLTQQDAPHTALAELEIAWDGDLFATKMSSPESLRDNVLRAVRETQEVLALGDAEIAPGPPKVGSLVRKVQNAPVAERANLEALIEAIRAAQRGPTPERLRAIRLNDYRRLTKTRGPKPPPPPASGLEWRDVEREVINLLLARQEENCRLLFEAIANTQPDQGTRDLEWDFGKGPEPLGLDTLRAESEALLTLASDTVWGGVAHFHADQPTPALLRQLPASRLTQMQPSEIVFIDDQSGAEYTLENLLAAWDSFGISALAGGSGKLVELWERWVTARKALLAQQEWLFLSPITLLAGDAAARAQARALLEAASELFTLVAAAREAMLEQWRGGAEALFQALLALDVVQVRIAAVPRRASAGNRLILLPTHPLQLWRGQTFVLKCLEAPEGVDERTRAAIFASLDRSDLYLPAWFASRLPRSEGAGKLLPFAGLLLGGVAIFQNLDNAIATIDGVEEIRGALLRFAAIHPEFCRPLRVTVVNPPDPERLLPTLAKCLDEPKGPQRLELRFTATGRLRSRLAEAQRLYLATGGELGDAINSGQLALELDHSSGGQGPNLETLVRDLSATPGHVLIIFDEADVDLQRRGLRGDLPMSPFTLTRELRRTGPPNAPRLELNPTFTESLFSGAQKIINSVDGSPGDSLSASVRATNYVAAIHAALLSDAPTALWTIVADRALPGLPMLKCQSLQSVRLDVREVGVFCRDLSWLARRVKGAFHECNLELRDPDLEGLLRDGSALLAGGLLDLVQVRDGAPNMTFVQGLAGTLFAARAWKGEHPDGLLLTVDSPVARSWLGLGETSVRSDLIGLWEHAGQLEIEAIEVKTSHDSIVTAVIDEAVAQVATTLDAIKHGLTGTDVLAVPRREMLKEVLKHAVDVAPFEHELATRQVRQQRWIGWLMRLFGEGSPTPTVSLSGRVVCVHLRDRNPQQPTVVTRGDWNIRVECIGEERCLELGLALATTVPRGTDSGQQPPSGGSGGTPVAPKPQAPPPASSGNVAAPAAGASRESASGVIASTERPNEPNILLGEKTGGGGPVFWRPRKEGRQIYNPHTVIIGGSGSGKTETLKVFLSELHWAGVGCLVFDFKDDYVQPDFVSFLNATVHYAEEGLPVNPMVPGVDPLTGRIDITSHIFTIEGTLTKVYGLGDQQANALRQALFAVYERAGYLRTPGMPPPGLHAPSFSDIRAELEHAEATSLLGRLQPIFDLNLFRPDRGGVSDLFKGLQVVRFTRLPGEEVKKACAEILLLGCYNEILRLGHSASLRLAVVIDEAHRIANLAAVSLLLREARAYGVGIFLSSQQARDFADDIYANADTLVGLKLNEPRDAERLGALLAGSARGRDLAEVIRHFQPGEAFVKNADYTPYVRLRITPLSQRHPPSSA
jgi:hypothetical protein